MSLLRTLSAPLVVVAALIACSGGQKSESGSSAAVDTLRAAAPTPPSDAQIFAVLSEANHAEIDAAQLALKKASHASVKAFAHEMIKDHTAMLQQGDSLAKALNVTPQAPANDSLAQHVQQEKHALDSAKSGAAFDQQYMQAQTQDHQTVLALIQQYASQTQTAQLKDFLTKAQPHVQHHLARAQAIDSTLTK